jgi:predicted PurR-regulated permease PerM
MNQPRSFEPLPRVLVSLAAAVVIVAGLKAASAFFVPFLLALFLAILSLPLLQWLRARRVPKTLAVALTVVADLALVALLGWAFAAAVADVTDQAPAYQARIESVVDGVVGWLERWGLPASDWITPSEVSPRALADVVSSTFVGVATVVSALFLVLLLLVFMLLESVELGDKLRLLVGADPDSFRRYSKITREVQSYLLYKTLVSLATGLSVGIWVGLLGLDFPALWGFVAFALNYIPNIGSILAAVPAVGLALLQLGPGRALVIALGYGAINFWWGNLVEPALLGRRLQLSPLVVLVSLIFWGWVWGPIGMLLSVPLTMMLKIVLENSPGLRWLGALLAPKPPAPAPAAAAAAPTGAPAPPAAEGAIGTANAAARGSGSSGPEPPDCSPERAGDR